MKKTIVVILTISVLILLSFTLLSLAQTTHGIQLAWTQSTSTGVIKNTVYQSSVKGGPYSPCYTSAIPVTSYLVPVNTTNQGTFACFVVTASTSIIESLVSNESCNTFPVLPAAPTSLSSGPV